MSKGTRLWDKGGTVDAEMLRFTARDDHELDRRLISFDLKATRAHVRGLARIGALTGPDAETLVGAIGELEKGFDDGSFDVGPEHEDGHTAIEEALVAKLGDLGKRVHLGRSRNDQVLVAMRLYERSAVDDLVLRSSACARSCLDLAEREERTPMPGYTHLQRAVPSTLGYWAAAFGEGFTDAAIALLAARAQVDRCPLGGAAGFGVNLPLDREGVARELGFAELAWNPLASQTSRGIVEAALIGAIWQASAIARRLAWDLSLFATAEVGFVTLDPALTTGSSIMPNKRNPDVVELLRASCSIVEGALTEVMALTALPSGYHRDLQLTKAPTMRALEEARSALGISVRVIAGLRFDRARMAAAVTQDMLATDRAVDLAAEGMPFRDAYAQVAREVGSSVDLVPDGGMSSVAARTSPGSPGKLGVDLLRARLDAVDAKAQALRAAPSDEGPD